MRRFLISAFCGLSLCWMAATLFLLDQINDKIGKPRNEARVVATATPPTSPTATHTSEAIFTEADVQDAIAERNARLGVNKDDPAPSPPDIEALAKEFERDLRDGKVGVPVGSSAIFESINGRLDSIIHLLIDVKGNTGLTEGVLSNYLPTISERMGDASTEIRAIEGVIDIYLPTISIDAGSAATELQNLNISVRH